MAKSMEVRDRWIGEIYLGVFDRHKAVLNGPRFKPDIRPLGDKYDKNKSTYEGLRKRKAALSKYLTQLVAAKNTRDSTVVTLNADRDKAFDQNSQVAKKYADKIQGFIDAGEKANPSEVADQLDDYAESTKELMELDNAHADKKEKVNAQFVETVKKIKDGYVKDSKDITAAVSKLEAEEEHLEAQIKGLILKFQKIAVEIGDTGLEDDLQLVLKSFP